jgi:hypothetical protein
MKENKYLNNLILNNNTNKISSSKILLSGDKLYDEIEKKEKEIKNLKNEIDKYKKGSIQEFVYSNRKIPSAWKNKRNFKKMVLELLVEDNNFLKYLGSEDESTNIANDNTKKFRPKTAFSEKKSLRSSNTNISNIINSKKNILNISNTLNSIKSMSRRNTTNIYLSNPPNIIKKSTTQNKNIMSSEDEVENIFDDLKNKYPIKKKLEELYPNYNFEQSKSNVKLNMSNKDEKIYSLQNLIDKSKLNKIKRMERNIYNNLFKKKYKTKNYSHLLKKNDHYKLFSKTQKNMPLNTFKVSNEIKKEFIKKELNDSKIFNQLHSINFYGPYFSYCPHCSNNNIKYYKNMERSQCISLLNHIKLERSKKFDIEETKFREKLRKQKSFNK